jgi:hypothetical protein
VTSRSMNFREVALAVTDAGQEVALVGRFRRFAAVLVALAWVAAAPVGAATPVEGEYDCDDCQGFLTVRRISSTELQVWLGVGGGSCGGEVSIDRKLRYVGGVLEAPNRQDRKKCRTRIEFTADGAVVRDSCAAQDEENSTCALPGTYTKRNK